MATPTFSINGGSNLPGVQANWQRVIKRRQPNGVVVYQNYALHTWDIPQMAMANFLVLAAAQGERVTLATTDLADINNGASYASAEIVGVIGGEQVGQRMTQIRVEFRVDV